MGEGPARRDRAVCLPWVALLECHWKRKLVFTSVRPSQLLCGTRLETGDRKLSVLSPEELVACVPKPREHPVTWHPTGSFGL